jgi:ubiquinone biosynthesis protein UbiJ
MPKGPMSQKVWQLMANRVGMNPKLAEIAAFKSCIEELAKSHDDLEQRVADLERQLADASRIV